MTPATTTTTPAINYFRVVVAGDYALSQIVIDSMSPAITLSAVTMTPAIINRQ